MAVCFTQRSKGSKEIKPIPGSNHTTELSSRRRRELAVCFTQRSKGAKELSQYPAAAIPRSCHPDEGGNWLFVSRKKQRSKVKKKLTNKSLTLALAPQFVHSWQQNNLRICGHWILCKASKKEQPATRNSNPLRFNRAGSIPAATEPYTINTIVTNFAVQPSRKTSV